MCNDNLYLTPDYVLFISKIFDPQRVTLPLVILKHNFDPAYYIRVILLPTSSDAKYECVVYLDKDCVLFEFVLTISVCCALLYLI